MTKSVLLKRGKSRKNARIAASFLLTPPIERGGYSLPDGQRSTRSVRRFSSISGFMASREREPVVVAVDCLYNGAQPLLARPIEERRRPEKRGPRHAAFQPALPEKPCCIRQSRVFARQRGQAFCCPVSSPNVPAHLATFSRCSATVSLCPFRVWRFGKIDCVFRPRSSKEPPTLSMPKFHDPKIEKALRGRKPPR